MAPLGATRCCPAARNSGQPGDETTQPVTSWAVPSGGNAVDPRSWRVFALVAGVLATVLMVIVGCTSVTGGTAVVDTGAAPAYRTSVSISLSESAATSSERESKRQVALTTQAVHHSCDALASSSVDAITAVNAFVGAFNNGGSGAAESKEGPAIDALNHTADLVSGSLGPELSPQLRDALTGWADAARAVAGAISSHASPDDFNATVGRLNDAKTQALNMCDAAY